MARIVLFDGTTLDNFTTLDGQPNKWILNDDGTMTVNPLSGSIVSKATYKDAHIHVEWMEPDMPEAEGQYKGNSGVYIHGCYELQVLDSYGVEEPGLWDCGSIYSIYAPLKNACKPALEWQTYDIFFRAPRYDDNGEMVESARVTILQNGELIQNNVILRTNPGGITNDPVAEGPLMLQDHGDPLTFRNIWIETL